MYDPLTVIDTGGVLGGQSVLELAFPHETITGGDTPKAQLSRVTPCPHDVEVEFVADEDTGAHESYVVGVELDDDDDA